MLSAEAVASRCDAGGGWGSHDAQRSGPDRFPVLGSFHSLRAAVDYTLVQRLSSRGYQNVAWYILQSPQWINPAILCARIVLNDWQLAAAIRRNALGVASAFVGCPCFRTRSALRDSNRAVVCLAAVSGLRDLFRSLVASSNQGRSWWAEYAVAAGLLLGLAHDVGHWRLPRTNSDVGAAGEIARLVPAGRASPSSRRGGWAGICTWIRIRSSTLILRSSRTPSRYSRGRPTGTWVALDAGNSAPPSLESALVSRGYRAVALPGDSTHRLWRPRVYRTFVRK